MLVVRCRRVRMRPARWKNARLFSGGFRVAGPVSAGLPPPFGGLKVESEEAGEDAAVGRSRARVIRDCPGRLTVCSSPTPGTAWSPRRTNFVEVISVQMSDRDHHSQPRWSPPWTARFPAAGRDADACADR